MTRTADKGKKTAKGAKKLSLKKETVKDLNAGPGKAKELGDDQLNAVNGGIVNVRVVTVPCLKQTVVKCLLTRPSCEQTTPGGGC